MSNTSFKLIYIGVTLHLSIEDHVMVRIRPEWFPFGSVQKLQARSAGSFQVLKGVGSDAYVIDILPDYGISSTFNREDLVAYRGQPVIPNGPFEDPLLDPATNSIPNC
jgi:hypothetical protein